MGVEADSITLWDASTSSAKLLGRLGLGVRGPNGGVTCAALDRGDPDVVVCGVGTGFKVRLS